MSQPPLLLTLPISPWSERARWALDHHGIAYTTQVHLPFLGERRLRRLVGPGPKRATVPVLVTDGGVLPESWDIALWADRNGSGSRLIPDAHAQAIRDWAARADAWMGEGRALIVAGMLQSPAALDEALPRSVPGWLRRLLRPMTRYSTAWFGRKYGVIGADLDRHRATLRAGLAELRAALGGRETLLESFSYADIVVATALQGVKPVQSPTIRLGPATRQVWTQPELAAEFADLLDWRDALYASRRKR